MYIYIYIVCVFEVMQDFCHPLHVSAFWVLSVHLTSPGWIMALEPYAIMFGILDPLGLLALHRSEVPCRFAKGWLS